MDESRLIYTIPEAATMLGMSRSKAYAYARTGELRTVRFGTRKGVPKAALGEMLEKHGGDAAWVDSDDSPSNTVTISGRLTRDVELRTAHSGLSFCVMRLAVRKRPGDDGAIFIDVVAFGDLTDRAVDLRKGQLVRVHGRLDQREWTTEDGTRRETHQIVARAIDRLRRAVPSAS